jgi:hypothetical protein
VARGNEKGRVERAIRYVRESFFAARAFTDLDDLNAHLSRKTQRIYGTASQGKPAHSLKPLRIEAERPVQGATPDVGPNDPDEPESAS